MLSNNIRHGKQYEYQVVHDGKEWFAWFMEIVPATEQLAEELPKSEGK
jgi:hypothetical protein